ncbi:MAG: dTDP-4-amino-4,6-dideoxygalactose transaminase [Candidatus Eremiobacteraeota bacterium]|nr:dTDP-4-amino-4,6-dideoxygalactose transaminase [Candidatus Eremiobacteraeota bacterium]
MSGVRYVNFARFADAYAEQLQDVVSTVLRSGVYIGGPALAEFERSFAAYCGTRFAVGVANGTEAIELTLRAWNVGAGAEVIVPANTAVQTALAVTHTGARVVLVDVESDTGLIDPAGVEAALTSATRAIVPVHMYGHPADVDRLRTIVARAGVHLLEDAAHAHGARYRGRRCGGLADAAAFSFYPTKNLGAVGDAGCVTTDDPQLAERLRTLRACGLTQEYVHVEKGYTSRLDPLQAAILNWKLVHLDAWNERRRTVARMYLSELAGVPGVTLPGVRSWAQPVWYAFPVCVHGGARDAVRRRLADDGIETNVHYPVPVHLQPCYADGGWRHGDFPVSERRAAAQLSLPLDPFHTDEEIARVVASVRSATSSRPAAVSIS